MLLLVLAVAGAGSVSALNSRAGVSPVQKVIQLLGELEGKIVKDGQKQQVAYEAYAEWCRTGAQDKEWEIKTAKASIEDLTGTIAKAESDIETLKSKIETVGAEIVENEADLKAATEIREKEHKEFTATEAELMDAVDTLERATNVLQRKLGGSALMQAKVSRKDVQNLVHTMGAIVDAAGLSLHDRQRLTALAQSDAEADADDDSDADELGAPAPAAYASKSESIIDVLEDLKVKAETELRDVRKAEVNSRHNYELLKQSLEDQIKTDTQEMADAKTMKADAAETKAVAEGDLAVSQKELANAKKVLGSMGSDCAAAARDHELSVKTRAEELKTIAEAKKAIADSTAGAAAVAYSDPSFLQLVGGEKGRAATGSNLLTRIDLANFEVVNLVRKLAREHNSAALAQLAGRISTLMKEGASLGEDPFAKVRALISNMIERLIKEGGEEMQHKAYCDKEMAETSQKLDELKYDLEKLGSKIDKSKAKSAQLKEDVATLSRELNEIARSQATADANRAEEKKAYEQAKADLEQGLEGIRLALKVLRDYYANDAGFLQQPVAAETHSASVGAGSSIIGLLEVIESDFGKSLASAEVEEQAAAVAYERLGMDNRVSKAMKEKDVEYKNKEAAGLDKLVVELSSDRDSAQTELDAVLEYSKNIRGMCVLKPESYEERAARRQQEIDGLKEALEILKGEAVLLQQTGPGPRRGLLASRRH